MEEIMYRLNVLENIRRGQEDAKKNKTMPVGIGRYPITVKEANHPLIQLRHIHDYIAQNHRACDAWCRNENVRELSLHSYRNLYEVKTIHVDVLAVILRKWRDLQVGEIPRES
ncbi:MAG: hypothetical protein ACYDC8_03630 [Gammaproteobacteria bacterium]